MSLYRDKGVVLRSYKLGESDRIVVIMTENFGKVRAVAKGVRKTKSKIGARLEPMSHVDIQLYRGRELDTVSQVESMGSAARLHNNLEKLSQGMSMLEAVDMVAEDRQPSAHLYRMLVGGLTALMEQDSPVMLPAFYWKLLAAEGVRPQVHKCIGCDVAEGLVAFDVVGGGVQCRNCRTGVSISEPVLLLLQQVLGGKLNTALAQSESSASFELAQLATQAMEHHIERRLRSVAMFNPRH